MSKQGSFKVSRINLENLNATGEANKQLQGNQATWEQQRKEFDRIIENIYEPKSKEKAKLQTCVQELFQYLKNSSDATKNQQLNNLGCVLNLLGTQLASKNMSTKSDKDDISLIKSKEQIDGSVKDFEKELEELRNRNNIYQQEISEMAHIKDKLKAMAERCTSANEAGLSKKSSVEIINSRSSIEGEKASLKHDLEELMIKKSSPESAIDQMNISLETIQIEFDRVYSQVQELKAREKEFEMKKREDPENKSFREKINMFNQQRKEKSLVLERKLSKLSHDSNDLAGSEANSPMMLSLGDDDINNNMRRENDELKKAMRLLKQKVEELEQENKQINEALLKKNNDINAPNSRKSSNKTEGQQSGTEDSENVKELKEKQRKLEVTIEDLQKKIELEKVAKNQIIELKKELELENYQLRTEKAKSQNSNQPSQSQSGTPTVENMIKLEEKVGDGPLSGERDELNLLLKEKEGFKAQVRHLTNAVNKLKHRSISLQEPLVESFEILGVIASIEREIFQLKYENEAYQTEGEQGSQPVEGSNSEGKGAQTTSQIAGLNVETLSKLLSAFDKVKPALNSYFIKLQESTSMSGSIRKKQSSISLEKRSLQLFNLEKMDESQRFIPDQEAQESRSPGIAVDAVSEDGREVILSEIAENVTERDHSEDHGAMEHFQLTRGTLETLYKCLDGYLKQAQQISNQGQEELIEVGKSEELQSFLAYVKDSGVGEMLYILQRNRVLHEENVQLKRNLKNMQRGEGSVIYNKDADDNENLSIGSKGSKVQSISYNKEDQNYGEDEQFSKSIVISDIDSGNQDTLDSPFMRKPTRNSQEADAPKTSAKRSKSLEEALEAETKAKEDLCKIILEKSVEIEQLAMENERLVKENEEIQGKLKELEKTYQNIMKECEATLIVCDELQETNSILRKTSEHADEEIKGLINSNKHIQELLSKAQNDLDAAKLEYQDLTDKYNQSQENNKQEDVAQEAEKQTNQSQNEFQELITKLQKEQEELTEECKALLLKYNDLQEENKQLAESNKNFVQEVQSHLENAEKAQMLIKNLEKEKEELAFDCKELLAKYNKLQETHSQLNQTHSSLDKEAQSQIENNNNAQEQILMLQKEKESLMTEAEALSNKHNQLQEEHVKLGQAHEISMKDIDHHLEKSKETEDLLAKLEKEKEALEIDCKNLLERHSKLEENHNQLNDLHSSSKEEIQRHLDEHKGAQELIAQLQKEKEDLVLENQNLNTKYKHLEGDNEQLNKAKEEILRANKEIQDSIATLEKENEILSKDYKELRERYTQLEETHKLMSNSNTSSSEEIQRQLDKNRQAQEQILKLEKENEAVRTDMESLVLKHNQLQEVHDQLSSSYKTVNDEASRHLENHKRAEEHITKLESEKENINMSHSELYDKFYKLQEMHEQLSKANQASGDEVKQHADSNKEAQDLIVKLQQEQEVMRKEAKILAEKHTELQERHMNLTKTQENSHVEIQQHLENIKLAQESISKLQKEKETALQDYNNITSSHNALQESHRQLNQANQDHLKTHQTLQDLIVKLRGENEELTRSVETEKMRKSTPKSAKGRHFPVLNQIDEVEQSDYPHDQTNIVLGTPVNKKVINLLDQLNSQIKTELTSRSRLMIHDDSDGSVNIMAPKQMVPGEKPKTLPKISYDILNWIADEALLVKKLCSLCDKEVRRDTQGEIKTVILELAQLNDGLKDYYNSCMEKNVDNPLRHFDFLRDLLIKCFEKQRTLQPIQTKIVSHIEGIVNARKTVK